MKKFEHVLVLLARGERPLPPETEATLAALQGGGARILRPQQPCSDVCYLRNKLLTDALQTDRETLLLLDDDMVLHTPEVLTEPDTYPRSAVYCSRDGQLAAKRHSWDVGTRLWLTGLGAFALEVNDLRELAGRLRRTVGAYSVFPFCTAGVNPDNEWEGDDYSFVRRLGGAILTDCKAGHVKSVPLWPDDETMTTLAKDETL